MTSSWSNPSGGLWSVAANWSAGSPPSATTTASITRPGDYLVGIEQPVTLAGLTLADDGATLLLTPPAPLAATTLDVTGALALDAGTLSLAGGEMAVADGFPGVLPGLPTTMLITPVVLDLGGGISGEGTISANFALIDAEASQSFAGATITLGNDATLAAGSGTLTLAGGLSVAGSDDALSGAIVNDGVLVFAPEGAAAINPYGAADFVNHGSVAITAGTLTGTVDNFTNSGEFQSESNLSLATRGFFETTGTFASDGETTLTFGAGPSAGAIAAQQASLDVRGAMSFATGTLTVGAGATLTLAGESQITAPAFVNDGTLILAAGTLTLATDAFTNVGSVVVDAGATLDLVLPASPSAPNLGQVGGAGWIEIDPPGQTTTMVQASALASATTDAPPTPPACFLAGTRIATEAGEIAVERLRPGMRVRTARGPYAPIIWIGERRIDCRRHPRPELTQPVRILAGAFAPGVPSRDLRLSPDHAIALRRPGATDRILVPVKCLQNGATIFQEDAAEAWYFHVELPRHDVILAEGLAVESYLDTANRADFANGGVLTALYPTFAPPVGWENACAPLCLAGEAVTRLRRRLFARAAWLGWQTETARDLRLQRGPRTWRPAIVHGNLHRFLLPADSHGARPATITILSNHGVPIEPEPARLDYRRLGLRIGAIFCDGRPVALDGPALGRGFYPIEADGEQLWRWTNGAGELSLPPRAAPSVLDLVILDAVTGLHPPRTRRVHQRLNDPRDDGETRCQNGAWARPGRAVRLRG
jgi:hypothetical protein